ncbi:hypothetical protein SAMN05216188_107197 [Lentzea xinjiangensis]|uniref:Uncharacterized protein n=1 Tax=Lentzea xinjiangensis TaxID=402600 RepID=A0A1H9L0A2_9PSEU|nr:hypothetical protein [Lentzea xinjiangensis]SER04874.1 hypothetical protein SAMN05216188_107197 [Lentzea xinjiangensis]
MNDDEFLDVLRAAAEEFDPVPAGVLRDASAALALRALDAELAALVESEALVRGDGPVTLAFESERVSVSLEISDDVLRGFVTGAAGEAVVETPRSRRAVPIVDGWFTATGVPSGLVRIRLTAADGTPVVTQWAHGTA